MPAIISLRVSDAEPADFWVEKRVTRLGSDGGCDLQIPSTDVAGHAATVQFRDGQYVVYNRSESPFSLSGHKLPPGESGFWPEREALRLASGVELYLLVDGDPAPSPRPSDNEAIEHYRRIRHLERAEEAETAAAEQAATASEAAKTGKGASTAQMVLAISFFLIAGVLLVGVLMYAFGSGDSAPMSWTDPRIVARVLLNQSSELPPLLVSRLQESQQAIRLGDADTARRRLLRLQVDLNDLRAEGVKLTVKGGDHDVDYFVPLTGYVNYYLSQFPAK